MPSNFPPLRTLTARLNDLPAQPTPLIGREKEVEETMGLIRRADVRLVTMTGAGGSGKTRLAIQVGAEMVDGFEAGVFFVPLATINEPALLPSTIAQQLGIREAPGRPMIETLQTSLRDKTALLILDNFEQITAAAPQLAALLEACARLKLLPHRLVETLEELRAHKSDLDELGDSVAAALVERAERCFLAWEMNRANDS